MIERLLKQLPLSVRRKIYEILREEFEWTREKIDAAIDKIIEENQPK